MFTTRFVAVTSLNSLVIGLRAAKLRFSETPILIDVMFVLYDMLNDDDVEIREAATLVASKALADDLTVFRLPANTGGPTKYLKVLFNVSLESLVSNDYLSLWLRR